MDSWHTYPSIFALGHKHLAELLLDPVTVEEKIDGCVAPETPILMADLTYRPAGDLCVGDRLIGVTDTVIGPRLCPAFVTAASLITKPCGEVVTTSRKVVASYDHPWLVAKPENHAKSTHTRKRWTQTENLESGDQIVALPVWGADRSRDAGYLAGFFDGEGALVRYKNQRILSAYQVTGTTFDRLQALIAAQGFTFSVDTRQRGAKFKEAGSVVIRGGWPEILRFLGTIRPERLLEKAEAIWNSAPMNYIPRETVARVCHIGAHDVMGLSTTSGTYIAAGMVSHNSQFSFGLFPENEEGALRCRSKGATLNTIAPDRMFERAVDAVRGLDLHPGWTYRAEYLMKPKHNALAYDRIPQNHLIVFDINPAHEEYLSWREKAEEAERIGLECVPLIFAGVVEDLQVFRAMLDRPSVLGGQKIEGVVVKNYQRFGLDKKCLMGKFVSEEFKEVHAHAWKESNPTQGDILMRLGDKYNTQARWQKAVQHLREVGQIDDSPRDIGLLFKEVWPDIEKECEAEIKDALYAWAAPHLRRLVTRGLPEWYKDRLLKRQFEQTEQAEP